MITIKGTNGITVRFRGCQYILSEEITIYQMPTDTHPQEPRAQAQSVSSPDALLEIYWEPMLSWELDKWIEQGDYSRNIRGIIETEED